MKPMVCHTYTDTNSDRCWIMVCAVDDTLWWRRIKLETWKQPGRQHQSNTANRWQAGYGLGSDWLCCVSAGDVRASHEQDGAAILSGWYLACHRFSLLSVDCSRTRTGWWFVMRFLWKHCPRNFFFPSAKTAEIILSNAHIQQQWWHHFVKALLSVSRALVGL